MATEYPGLTGEGVKLQYGPHEEKGESEGVCPPLHVWEETLEQCLKASSSDQMLSTLAHLLDSILVTEGDSGPTCSEGDVTLTPQGVRGMVTTPTYMLDRKQLTRLTQRVYAEHHDNDIAMTMLGVKCLDEEEYSLAELFFASALRANPECLVAMSNERVLFERMIHRWHFLMLNDVQRNSAYCKAIRKVVRELSANCSVIDIGSGTGLLR